MRVSEVQCEVQICSNVVYKPQSWDSGVNIIAAALILELFELNA